MVIGPKDLAAAIAGKRTASFADVVARLTAMPSAPRELWPLLLAGLRDDHYTFAIESLCVRTGTAMLPLLELGFQSAPRSAALTLEMSSRLRIVARLVGPSRESLFRSCLESRVPWIRSASIEALCHVDRNEASAIGLEAYQAAKPADRYPFAFALARVGTAPAIEAALDFEATVGATHLCWLRPFQQVAEHDLPTLLTVCARGLEGYFAKSTRVSLSQLDDDIRRATSRPLVDFPVGATNPVIYFLSEHLGRQDVLSYLVRLLEFPNYLTRRETASVLVRSLDTRALTAVARMDSLGPDLAKHIAAAARTLGPAASHGRAKEMLRAYLAERRVHPRATPAPLLAEALKGLAPPDAATWFDDLVRLLDFDASRAIPALAQLADARALPFLKERVDERTPDGRAAIIALGAFAGKPENHALLTVLERLGTTSAVRDGVVAAIHGLRDAGPAAASALRAIASRADLDNFTRLLVRDAIRKVGA